MSRTDDPREIRSWALYDWATSAFSTTVSGAIGGPYLTELADRAAGEDETLFRVLGLLEVSVDSYFAYVAAVSVLLQVLILPPLGALADRTAHKRSYLMTCSLIGAGTTSLLILAGGDQYLFAGFLLLIANIAGGAAIVFYNAFLPQIASPGRRDRVSSIGFAAGYVGGGLLLAANLALVTQAERLGLSEDTAVRVSLMSAGLWWGFFGVLAIRGLRTGGGEVVASNGDGFVRMGFRQVADSFRELRALPGTARFLVAYLLYNDGIQSVIGLASVFVTEEVFVAKGQEREDATAFLLGLILLIQFVAAIGAMGFERAARRAGTKPTVLVSLVIWCGVVLYAFAVLESTTQTLAMGVVIALVLGGSQALSRSLYSQMIPAGREASFFGFFEISKRGTAWIGAVAFAVAVDLTDSYRIAILTVLLPLAAGTVVLALTDTDRAIAQAAAVTAQ